MMKFVKYIFVWMIAAMAMPALAQDDLDLAEYYYNQGQFEQAKLYYEKIYKTNKTSKVYNNYLQTLIALRDLETAEGMVKKKIKENSKDGSGYVQLGNLYKKFDRKEDAIKQFDEAVKKFEPTRSNVIRLANDFEQIDEFQYAMKVYQKGKEESKEGYTFTFEMAKMQGNLGDFPGMIESFLDLIIEESAYVQTVQNTLNRTLNIEENEDNQNLLKTALLRRTQKSPDEPLYNEMLVWLFMQRKDFASAYVQAVALDKRYGENGYRLINLASLSQNSKDFTTAIKCYQYVIDKGPMSEYYISAKIDKLQVMKEELNQRPGVDRAAYVQLESEYISSLEQVGKTAETAVMMKELAHVQAFFLQKSEDAVALLREAIDMPGVFPKVQAMCKLELGDILVFRGEIWDASLLFSQVELDYKEDILGSEAKFRNARVSYYTGDFEWAQGQLDVLKASTSKLISNDAIDLSLLITDNFNMDTTKVPMEQFARADLLAYQNRFDDANRTLDSILTTWPYHSLTDEIKMLKASMYMKQAKYDDARKLYEDVLSIHFKDITADDALFKLAEMEQYIYLNNQKAMELYEKLINEYTGSLYVVEARRRFRILRGDAVE